MDTDNINHFVGFVTQLNYEAFVEQWAHYAGKFASMQGAVMLQEKLRGNGKYKYISQHAFAEEDFSFSFMKGRDSENFPEQTAKVIMLGGYTPLVMGHQHPGKLRMLVFLNRQTDNISAYNDGAGKFSLTVYQPFYENCLYPLILEFITDEIHAPVLMDEFLARKESMEISLCKECEVPHSVV